MIKISHIHPNGKACYVMGGRNRLTDAGIFSLNGIFAVAYMPYTGGWYAYDVKTGNEIAVFTREFYDRHIKHHRMNNLEPDPDCAVERRA